MAKILSGSIDLSKIDKTKIVAGKNGQKYYPIQVIINDEPNKYGQHGSVITNQTKEEREGKIAKNYLGNLKIVWTNELNLSEVKSENMIQSPPPNPSDDMPF